MAPYEASKKKKSTYYLAEIEDNFQQIEELCKPLEERCVILCRRLGVSDSFFN